ncbi:hypothetical protein C9374_009277 [Naegleria lovaniensis]|uniref:Guanylate cyclase domain-containing protein n=1 Tax=Naegleria lovaniensis TaxID=51637 RepID=A0AA88KGN9_NAELO|nr:uncharacterized protein C9374_009277 [Naegleria lovaniensis]KAG2377366.1 hypothetical protein C9374_009277 [Naegleria lovaniensis]
MPWISILAHLGNVFSKKASFIQHARFDHAYVGYYNDTFEVAENNITKFFQVIPRQLSFPSLSVRDLRLVKEAPYQDIDRPWVKEFFHKNASKPYWTNTFMSLYGQRAVNFVLPIFVNDKSFRRSPPSFPVRVKDSNLSNATFRYNTPFLQIDNLFAMVGIQFTLEYLSDYLKNLTRDSDVLRSFILNSNREILGSASKGGALENDTFHQELSTFIFNKNLGPSNTSSLYRTNIYSKFQVNIGINTGNMLCGCMGSPLRFCYTVIGDNVNIASRLQYLAQSYGCHIFIGENVQKVVQKAFICLFVDFIKLKGKRLSTSVYCLASFENEASEIQRKLAIDLEMAKEYLYKGEYYHLRQVCEKLVLLFMLQDDLKPEQIEFESELHQIINDREEYYGFYTIPLRLLHRSLQLITKAGCDT